MVIIHHIKHILVHWTISNCYINICFFFTYNGYSTPCKTHYGSCYRKLFLSRKIQSEWIHIVSTGKSSGKPLTAWLTTTVLMFPLTVYFITMDLTFRGSFRKFSFYLKNNFTMVILHHIFLIFFQIKLVILHHQSFPFYSCWLFYTIYTRS